MLDEDGEGGCGAVVFDCFVVDGGTQQDQYQQFLGPYVEYLVAE